MICGAIGETDDGVMVFCELEPKHDGLFHDVLLCAHDPDDPGAAEIDRFGEHFCWPNVEPPARGRDHFVHNCIAHPLLVLWPRFGRWLHDHTKP